VAFCWTQTTVVLPAVSMAIFGTAALPASAGKIWLLSLLSSGQIFRAGNASISHSLWVEGAVGQFDLGTSPTPASLIGSLVTTAP
jgi:hypothetical protein